MFYIAMVAIVEQAPTQLAEAVEECPCRSKLLKACSRHKRRNILTKQFKTLQNVTQLYNTFQNYTTVQKYRTLQDFTRLLQKNTKMTKQFYETQQTLEIYTTIFHNCAQLLQYKSTHIVYTT